MLDIFWPKINSEWIVFNWWNELLHRHFHFSHYVCNFNVNCCCVCLKWWNTWDNALDFWPLKTSSELYLNFKKFSFSVVVWWLVVSLKRDFFCFLSNFIALNLLIFELNGSNERNKSVKRKPNGILQMVVKSLCVFYVFERKKRFVL